MNQRVSEFLLKRIIQEVRVLRAWNCNFQYAQMLFPFWHQLSELTVRWRKGSFQLTGIEQVKFMVYTWQLIFVSVSLGCCNKLPKTRWLKTVNTYCLTVLEVKWLKSRLVHLSLHSLTLSSCDLSPCLYIVSPLVRAPTTLDLGSSLLWYELILTGYIRKDIYF